jgi:hypothetical protein
MLGPTPLLWCADLCLSLRPGLCVITCLSAAAVRATARRPYPGNRRSNSVFKAVMLSNITHASALASPALFYTCFLGASTRYSPAPLSAGTMRPAAGTACGKPRIAGQHRLLAVMPQLAMAAGLSASRLRPSMSLSGAQAAIACCVAWARRAGRPAGAGCHKAASHLWPTTKKATTAITQLSHLNSLFHFVSPYGPLLLDFAPISDAAAAPGGVRMVGGGACAACPGPVALCR